MYTLVEEKGHLISGPSGHKVFTKQQTARGRVGATSPGKDMTLLAGEVEGRAEHEGRQVPEGIR